MPEITHRVYFDIEIGGEETGRIVFALFGKNAPEAAENFRVLSTCEQSSKLCYKQTKFHRIIPSFAAQGGDITNGDGTGGRSIYNSPTFESTMKETTKMNKPGLLATAAKPSLASSQFFVTTVKTQWLTGKHTVFGMVLEGMEVLEEIERSGTYGGKPTAEVVIADCGEHPLQDEDREPHY